MTPIRRRRRTPIFAGCAGLAALAFAAAPSAVRADETPAPRDAPPAVTDGETADGTPSTPDASSTPAVADALPPGEFVPLDRLGDYTVDGPQGPGRHHYALGLALARAGLHDGAIEEFKAAIAIEPDEPRYFVNWSASLLSLNEPAEALEVAGQAVAIAPEHGSAWFNLGVARQRSGLHAEAEQALTRAVELLEDQDELFKARVWLARSFLRRATATVPPDADLADAAVANFLEAIAIAPDVGLVHYQLADALVARGDLELAAVHYTRSAELVPGRREPHDRLAEIEAELARRAAADDARPPR